MKKEIKFYVIGGQYENYCYGGTPTLIGAKRLANKNKEYWDNWQGWNTPEIYKAEDTIEIVSKGRMTSCDGELVRVPKMDAMPIMD